MVEGHLKDQGGSLGGPSFSFGLLSPESELSLSGVGDPLGLQMVLTIASNDSGLLKISFRSVLEASQLCRGGYCSLEESFGVLPIIVPNLVLVVMLEIGRASGNVTLLGFLGVSSPEMVSWRFTDFRGVAGSGFNYSLGR